MLSIQQPKSRWVSLIERWDERLTRLKDSFSPFSQTPARPIEAWKIIALSAGLIVLAVLIVLGAMWAIANYKGMAIYLLFKMGKFFVFGFGLLLALAFRGRIAHWPLFGRNKNAGVDQATK
jgi:hypothetical protein